MDRDGLVSVSDTIIVVMADIQYVSVFYILHIFFFRHPERLTSLKIAFLFQLNPPLPSVPKHILKHQQNKNKLLLNIRQILIDQYTNIDVNANILCIPSGR